MLWGSSQAARVVSRSLGFLINAASFFKVAMAKVKAYELRTKKKDELLKQLEELKNELAQALSRVALTTIYIYLCSRGSDRRLQSPVGYSLCERRDTCGVSRAPPPPPARHGRERRLTS